MKRTAKFSPCRKYRYLLTRDWSASGSDLFSNKNGTIYWIMLNPSTADEFKEDPTITRCIGFSQMWGFAKLHILNIFAFRSTLPNALYTVDDPVGPDNNQQILELNNLDDPTIVCAWGNHGEFNDRGREVAGLLSSKKIFCLGTTNSGQPKHPLYLAKNTELQELRLR